MLQSKKKTILYLRTDLGAETLCGGGSISHSVGVINGFLGLGYTVISATSAVPALLKNLSLASCVCLKNPRIISFLGYKINALLSNVFFTITTLRLLKKYPVDMIYQRYSMLNVTGVFLSWWYNIPLIIEFNGSEVWTNIFWAPKKLVRLTWLVGIFEKMVLRYAHHIVVVSQPLKDRLVNSGIYEKKILVNPNGVDAIFFDPARLHGQRREIRARLGISEKYVYGFIGTFSWWHGINVLVDIIPRIVRLRSDVHFLLIGHGPLVHMLQNVVQEHDIEHAVTFLGAVSHDEARSYLAACDAFLSPTQPNPDGSPFFGSPTKIFEYMSLGKPIIASDLGQLSEVLQPAFLVPHMSQKKFHVTNQVGIIVPSHDIKGFLQALCMLGDLNNEDSMKLGANARKRALERYTWHHHTQRIIQFITAEDL